MHVNASERTPVSEAEVDETIAASREFATDLANGKTNGELSKRAEVVLGHLDNILWRLAEDAPRRAELTGAKDHLRNSLRVRGGSEQVSDES
jgi:hypothetical protein